MNKDKSVNNMRTIFIEVSGQKALSGNFTVRDRRKNIFVPLSGFWLLWGGGGPAKAAKKLENGMKSSHEAKVFENHMSMESFHVNTTSSIVR